MQAMPGLSALTRTTIQNSEKLLTAAICRATRTYQEPKKFLGSTLDHSQTDANLLCRSVGGE